MLKMMRIVYLLLTLAFRSTIGTQCDPAHKIEAIYSGYSFVNAIEDFVYVIEPTSYDIAAAAMLKERATQTNKWFFFYLDQSSCSVSWHYHIHLDITVNSIAIDKPYAKVYALAAETSTQTGYLL